MRTNELLTALACHGSGIEARLDSKRAVVLTRYEPRLYGFGKTLFDAALDLAKQMLRHPDCPPNVEAALESYDERTCILAL